MDETMLCFPFMEDENTQVVFDMEDFATTFDHHHHATEDKKIIANDEFCVPDIPDELDDFSWLFRVLPADNQVVPESDNDRPFYDEYEERKPDAQYDPNIQTQVLPCNELELTEDISPPSLFESSMLCNMDVSSLLDLNESVDIGLNKFGTELDLSLNVCEDIKVPLGNTRDRTRAEKRRSVAFTETPVLRRSSRKRKSEKISPTPLESPRTSKRRKSEPARTVSRKEGNQANSANKTPILVPTVHQNPKSQLKITFRKHKPVNPIDRLQISNHGFKRGLIDAGKQLAGELYYSHCISPKLEPGLTPQDPNLPPFATTNPLNCNKIKEMMKLEHIRSHNRVANKLARGIPISEINVTPAAARGKKWIQTVNLDIYYDHLLTLQEAQEDDCVSQPSPPTDSPSMNSTFLNMFSDYFPEELEGGGGDTKKKPKMSKYHGLVGAIPIRKSRNKADQAFLSKQIMFPYKGELYRPSPVVVTLVRTPDEVIQQVTSTSTPGNMSFRSSPYYPAMASQFEKTKTLKKKTKSAKH